MEDSVPASAKKASMATWCRSILFSISASVLLFSELFYEFWPLELAFYEVISGINKGASSGLNILQTCLAADLFYGK
ncbi:hypothetical protein V2J09_010999 [Rumex salicifolius]